MSADLTTLDLPVHNSPHNSSGTASDAIGGQVQPSDWLLKYRSFTDSLSLSYRKRAEELGFIANPKELPARNPHDPPIRCWELTRHDSIHSRCVIEPNMDSYLEGWREAMNLMHEVPFAVRHGEAP